MREARTGRRRGDRRMSRHTGSTAALATFAAVALFAFIFYWNDFFGPLIYLPSASH